MSVGICKSCSPVLDAVKLAANPKADLNGDGKITTSELQTTELQKGTQNPDVKDLLKTNTDSTSDPYIASKSPSPLSGGTIALLAEVR